MDPGLPQDVMGPESHLRRNLQFELAIMVRAPGGSNYGLCLDAVPLLHSIGADPDQAVATEAAYFPAH